MIGCNDYGLLANQVIHCAVNPTLYKYECPKIVKTDSPKKIAVIGGGPAGLEAAVTAKRRGHDVILFEKRKIGGLLIEAGAPEYKKDIRRLITYYETQLKKLGIPVIEKEATAADIKNGGFERAIVAVGAVPRVLDIPGINHDYVTTALEVLGGKIPEGEIAVVVGGGITGAETALELAAAGKQVTVVEMLDRFLAKFSAVNPAYFEAIAKAGIKIITGKRLEKVEDKKAVIVDRYGNKEELETDIIVISAGFEPQHQLAEELDEFIEDVIEIGDGKQVRQIYDAIREGYAAARNM